MDDVKGVAFLSQVFNCPFESNLAAFGEVQCNTNVPVLYHAFFLALRSGSEFEQQR